MNKSNLSKTIRQQIEKAQSQYRKEVCKNEICKECLQYQETKQTKLAAIALAKEIYQAACNEPYNDNIDKKI